MTKSSDRRIVHVRVLIEATHADDPALFDCKKEDLASVVEAVRACIPLLHGESNKGVTFGCGRLLHLVQIGARSATVLVDQVVHPPDRRFEAQAAGLARVRDDRQR